MIAIVTRGCSWKCASWPTQLLLHAVHLALLLSTACCDCHIHCGWLIVCAEAAPGYVARTTSTGVTAVECADGYYKSDWGAGPCIPCGLNPYQTGGSAGTAYWHSEQRVSVSVFFAGNRTTSSVQVRASSASCCKSIF